MAGEVWPTEKQIQHFLIYIYENNDSFLYNYCALIRKKKVKRVVPRKCILLEKSP